MRQLLMFFLLFASIARAESETPKPVSNTVTIQFLTVRNGGTFFRPGITWDIALGDHWSVPVGGDLDLTVDVRRNGDYFYGADLRFEGGIKYWVLNSRQLEGFSIGLDVVKSLNVHLYHYELPAYQYYSGFYIDQQLGLLLEAGWQWVLESRHVINLRFSSMFYDDKRLQSEDGLFEMPSLGFKVGWAW